MRFFRRKPELDLAGHLTKGERVFAWTNHAGGKLVVTNLALLSFDHHEQLRLPWELSLSGKWDEPTLVVTSQAELSEAPVTRAWQLTEPGLVPDSVRERITSAQVFDQVRTIEDIGKVRFVARRGPNGVAWTTLTDAELTPDSQVHIQDELRMLRETLGI